MQADRTIERRMAELARRTAATGHTTLSAFLTPAEQVQADICARKAGVSLALHGGYPGAERKVAAFCEAEDTSVDWPVACLRVSWRPRATPPGHRDLLGSLMGLGFERALLGDILPGNESAHVFLMRHIADYIRDSVQTVGQLAVRLERAEPEAMTGMAAGHGEPVYATLPSLRLDALIGAAFNLSRRKASEVVASGRVQVNHMEELRPDRAVEPGMVISVRGMGRALIEEVTGLTRKGRLGVRLLRY